MSDHSLPVGRVLRSSTASLTLGTKTLAADVPRFGGFVKVAAPDGGDIIHVKITRQVVLGEAKPIVRRKQDAEAA